MNRLLIALALVLGIALSLYLFLIPAKIEVTNIDTSPPQSIESSSRLEVVGDGSYEKLKEFIERFMSPSSLTGEPYQARIHLGQFPLESSFQVLNPPGSRVVGSISIGPSRYMATVDAPVTAERAIEFYRNSLKSQGWEIMGRTEMRGFDSGFPEHQEIFCDKGANAEIRIWAVDREGLPTDVRIGYSLGEEYSQCNQAERIQSRYLTNVLPYLSSPSGSYARNYENGSSSDSSHSTMVLRTSDSGKELLEHFDEQLLKAGWTKLRDGSAYRIDWSSWAFSDKTDQNWDGMLYIIQDANNEEKYFATLQAFRQR